MHVRFILIKKSITTSPSICILTLYLRILFKKQSSLYDNKRMKLNQKIIEQF